ncbi:hypothetical protein F511_31577 [Dorcoceras hygrometricum]|uniref:Uncharacterized protein n=1 Tax=Dorcoceras hygrometricum TaxID=472368 RepID=A0A2Z7BNW5_9LAMI|nr:hypothetical protein F511_31577 [Dorcoceras hygrometricum]
MSRAMYTGSIDVHPLLMEGPNKTLGEFSHHDIAGASPDGGRTAAAVASIACGAWPHAAAPSAAPPHSLRPTVAHAIAISQPTFAQPCATDCATSIVTTGHHSATSMQPLGLQSRGVNGRCVQQARTSRTLSNIFVAQPSAASALKRTTSGKAVSKEKDLALISVARDVEPIFVVPAKRPHKRKAPKRKLRMIAGSDDEIVQEKSAVQTVLVEQKEHTSVDDVDTIIEEVIAATAHLEIDLAEPAVARSEDITVEISESLTAVTDEESRSIEDLLKQIPGDAKLPSVLAAEPTKIKFGLGIQIPGISTRVIAANRKPRREMRSTVLPLVLNTAPGTYGLSQQQKMANRHELNRKDACIPMQQLTIIITELAVSNNDTAAHNTRNTSKHTPISMPNPKAVNKIKSVS